MLLRGQNVAVYWPRIRWKQKCIYIGYEFWLEKYSPRNCTISWRKMPDTDFLTMTIFSLFWRLRYTKFTISTMTCTFMLSSASCHVWTYLGMLQWFGDNDIPCGYNQNWYKALQHYTSSNSAAMKSVDQRFNSLNSHILLSFEDFFVTGCNDKFQNDYLRCHKWHHFVKMKTFRWVSARKT